MVYMVTPQDSVQITLLSATLTPKTTFIPYWRRCHSDIHRMSGNREQECDQLPSSKNKHYIWEHKSSLTMLSGFNCWYCQYLLAVTLIPPHLTVLLIELIVGHHDDSSDSHHRRWYLTIYNQRQLARNQLASSNQNPLFPFSTPCTGGK
jgi:hypothetical protein